MKNFNHFLDHFGLDQVLAESIEEKQDNIFFIDYCRVRDKYDFIEDMAEAFQSLKINVIDGFVSRDLRAYSPRINFITPPPEIYYNRNYKLTAQELRRNGNRVPEELENAVSLFYRHAQQNNEYVDENIIRNCVRTAYYFTLLQLKVAKPKFIFLWNQFHPLSQAVYSAAKLLEIAVIYLEYGVLPGTFNIDIAGQMGESWIANNSEEFNKLPITPADIEKAKLIMADLRMSGLNRRIQKDSDLDNLFDYVKFRANGRPIIFFAGHNDLASGMYPYTSTSKKYHSPIFESSSEAASHIVDLAEKLGYYVIYKPHPFFLGDARSFDKNYVYFIGDVNINDCVDVADVVCTVLSQVSYLALLRKKPLVLLGFNQMRDKNICYEAYNICKIQSVFEMAVLKQGYETHLKLATEHVARLIKYYLYAWSSKNNIFSFASFTDLASRLTSNLVKTEDFNIGI